MEGYYTITLEDLLAGAFLAININQNRFLSYSKLSDYEKKVGEFMKRNGYKCRFDLGRNQTSWVLYYNSDYFEELSIDNKLGILLKSNITKDDIRRKFTGYLGLPVLKALYDKSCMCVL